jgi:hypothetical protein
MRERLRVALLGEDWRTLVRSPGVGLALAVPTAIFALANPAGPFLAVVALAVVALVALYVVRFGPGFLGALVASLPPSYFLVPAVFTCGPTPDGAVAVCMGPPPQHVVLSLVVAFALVASIVACLTRVAIRRVG